MSRPIATKSRDWRALLAPLTHLTEAEAARVLGCARSSVAAARRAHPELAGPKGRPGPKARGRPGPAAARVPRPERLNIRASVEELAQLDELAAKWQTTTTGAVWGAVDLAARLQTVGADVDSSIPVTTTGE